MTLVTGSWILDALLLLIPVLYWYATRNYSFWKNLGIPYMKPTPFLGSMLGVVTGRQHLGEPALECYKKAGDARFMGMYAFDEPLLVVKDPELVGRILATDFASFYSTNANVPPETAPLFAQSLFALNGHRWKSLRKNLTPAFTSGKIKQMFQLVNEVGVTLVNHLENTAGQDGKIEVNNTLACYATDVVSSIFMGVGANSLQDKDSSIRSHLRLLLRENFTARLGQALAFLSPKLLRLIPIRLGSDEADNYFLQSTEHIMEHRKTKGVVRGDIIDMLMKIRDEQLSDDEDTASDSQEGKASPNNKHINLSNEGIAAQLLSFLFAGFDTSASTLTFALFELARDRQLQDELRQHIRKVLTKYNGQFTYEALNDMTELTNVINETMRLHPPVNFHDRKAMCDYRIPATDIIIPKGTGVLISVSGLHGDPRYWQEPHRFIPNRFKEQNSTNRPKYTFLPFGEGPRMCIGIRLGYMQVKSGLAHIINNFEVSTTSMTPSTLKINTAKFIVTPKGDLPLRFHKIPPP